jgi:hypothetical protein
MHARYTSTINQKKTEERKRGRSAVFHKAGLFVCPADESRTLAAVSPHAKREPAHLAAKRARDDARKEKILVSRLHGVIGTLRVHLL